MPCGRQVFETRRRERVGDRRGRERDGRKRKAEETLVPPPPFASDARNRFDHPGGATLPPPLLDGRTRKLLLRPFEVPTTDLLTNFLPPLSSGSI